MFSSRSFLTAFLVLALCFTGCEKKTDAPAAEPPAAEQPAAEPPVKEPAAEPPAE